MTDKFKGELDRMHLQWFADEAEIEDDEGEEPEVVVVGEDEEIDEGEESGSPPSAVPPPTSDDKEVINAIKEGFQNLSRGNTAPPVPEQQPGESDEEFEKRFNEEIFGDNPAKVMKEMLNKYGGNMFNRLSQMSFKQAKKLNKLDPERGELFRKYEGEIDKKIAGLPSYQKNDPEALEWAYNEVKKEHEDEIIEDKVERLVNERLEKMGVGEGERKPFSEGKGVSSARSSGKKKKRYVKLTNEEKVYCKRRGISEEDYAISKYGG